MGNCISTSSITCKSIVVGNSISPADVFDVTNNDNTFLMMLDPMDPSFSGSQEFRIKDYADLHLLPAVIKHLIFHMLYGTSNIITYIDLTEATAPFVLEYTNSSKNHCHLLQIYDCKNYPQYHTTIYYYAPNTDYQVTQDTSQSGWVMMDPSTLTIQYVIDSVLCDGFILPVFWDYFFQNHKFIDIYMAVYNLEPDKTLSIIKLLNATAIDPNEHTLLMQSISKARCVSEKNQTAVANLTCIISKRLDEWNRRREAQREARRRRKAEEQREEKRLKRLEQLEREREQNERNQRWSAGKKLKNNRRFSGGKKRKDDSEYSSS